MRYTNQYYEWSVGKLREGSYLDKIMLSFRDEPEWHRFHNRHRNQYTIIHTLNNPTNGMFHAWVQKTKSVRVHYNTGKGRKGSHVWRSNE